MDVDVEITFDVEGTYGCIRFLHYQDGMVGLILVGGCSVDLDDAKCVRHSGRVAKTFEALFEKVE